MTAMRCDKVLHGRDIMGDEEIGCPFVGLQIEQQVHERALHRDVERRERLVAYDQIRAGRKSPGDGHPLLLSAAAARRIPPEVR